VQLRDVVNSQELEDHVVALGGEVVFPEALSAAEQIPPVPVSSRRDRLPRLSGGKRRFLRAWDRVHHSAPALGCKPVVLRFDRRRIRRWWHVAVGDATPGGHHHPIHASYEIPLTRLDEPIAAATGDRGEVRW
jgi:hypothetical protein